MQSDSCGKLPASGAARESLREKGQFWTPDWVAEAMVEYVLASAPSVLFDPAVGAGAFFRAAQKVAQEEQLTLGLAGMEIDPAALEKALGQGLYKDDLANVTIGDFVFQPPQTQYPAIVANPPYIRHHRIQLTAKEQLKQLGIQIVGKALDGRAGLHVYFLIRALSLLQQDGRLAFIVPADTCEGKFSSGLWRWIAKNFSLDAVITFSPEATPFPGVDTNPLILLIRKAPPKTKFSWARCYASQGQALKLWVRSGFQKASTALQVVERDLAEGLATGLSRPPVAEGSSKYVLGDFVRVMRGIATGANEFFLVTDDQARKLGIPAECFVRAIGRTRDVTTEEITQETVDSLRTKGRPTLLLSLSGSPLETYPEAVRQYLKAGEALGLPQRPLISQRRPWYRMETRLPPPFLFAYLGRRNSRFVRNIAKIVPLTGFLCIYPKADSIWFYEKLWSILKHPDTIANLALVGKSYGDGAIKVEPRSLEKLPIPDHVVAEFGLPMQMRLFERGEPYTVDKDTVIV